MPKLRSRSAEKLLGYLVLLEGSMVSRAMLGDLFWPDSELEQRSQNVRKALSDIRQTFGDPAMLCGDQGEVGLATDQHDSDWARFRRGTRTGQEGSLDEVAGDLMPDIQDPWILPFRQKFERNYLAVLEQQGNAALASGKLDIALQMANRASEIFPCSEQPASMRIRALVALGYNAEALKQFEDLEVMLDELFGEPPSADLVAFMNSLPNRQDYRATRIRPSAITANGALSLGDKTYVERSVDAEARRALARPEGLLLVQGPKQIGKSSLLLRIGREISRQASVVYVDLRRLDSEDLSTLRKMYKALGGIIDRDLGLAPSFDWDQPLGANLLLEDFLEGVLCGRDDPLVIIFDECDRLLERSFRADFFGLLRGWYNLRAHSQHLHWRRLTICLGYAADSADFITDDSQSPFNVGTKLRVEPFSLKETASLSEKCGLLLPSEQLEAVYSITGGFPYLSRVAFAAIQEKGLSAVRLLEEAASVHGPFEDQLLHASRIYHKDPRIRRELDAAASGRALIEYSQAARLESIGILSLSSDGICKFANDLYRRHFAEGIREK